MSILGSASFGRGERRGEFWLLFARVEYGDGDPEVYSLPLEHAGGEEARRLLEVHPEAVIVKVHEHVRDEPGVLYDALIEPSRIAPLLDAIVGRRRVQSPEGEIFGSTTPKLREISAEPESLKPSAAPGSETTSDVVFGDKLILKMFRRLEWGENPDSEMGRVLSDELGFPGTPPVVGRLEYRGGGDDELVTVGVLQAYVPNATTAYQFTADWLDRFLEHIVTLTVEQRPTSGGLLARSAWEMAAGDAPPEAREHLSRYLDAATAIGKLTAEFHSASARGASRNFVPEPFTQLYQRSLEQSTRKLTSQAFALLRRRLDTLAPATAERAG